jgi:hypothetical protein
MLRLDLLHTKIVNQFPEKTLFQYPDLDYCPSILQKFCNKVVIEKDTNSNILWFEKSFFEEIKFFYRFRGLNDDNDFIINDLTANFFQINEIVEGNGFNPSEFGIGMQIKIADDYAHFFWKSIMY